MNELELRINFQQDSSLRLSLNRLAEKTFGLSFEEWYRQGYWSVKCTPYAFFDKNVCAANVFANAFKIILKNQEKTYLQLGTVMTAPEYRGQGFSRLLIERILKDWRDRCDAVYLYANDGAAGFYPKFGFAEEQEYQYEKAVCPVGGTRITKLSLNVPADKIRLLEAIDRGNPYSALTMPGSTEYVMFHCMMFQQDHLYFLPEENTLAVAERDGDTLLVYDVFSDGKGALKQILEALSYALGGCAKVRLGFTPKDAASFSCAPFKEEDTHLFVLDAKENLFRGNRLMLPMLCRT